MSGLVAKVPLPRCSICSKKITQELQSEIAQSEATCVRCKLNRSKASNRSRELADLERQLVETNKSKEYESLRAPVKGYVFDLIVASLGYAASKERRSEVVPEGTRGQCLWNNADVGS